MLATAMRASAGVCVLCDPKEGGSLAMKLALYAHPFSSYCQKVLIALYECGIPFELKMLGPDTPANFGELARIWPLQRFPVLVDDGRNLMEASIIIEHIVLHHAGSARLLPADARVALDIRFMDRFFDNYIMTPMQRIVADAMRAPDKRDAQTVADAGTLLDTAYTWLDARMAGREWASSDAFSLADCAAAPSLFYADWAHPIDSRFAHVRAYRSRLLSRPSIARVVDEARPYRKLFPLGAPDRD
jgi:glutathione S-transferase